MFRYLQETWKFRALVSALVGRHLNARYRGSFFGFIWSFLNPLCLIAIYSLVFRYYIRFSQVDHYTLFLFAGLLPWIWFSTGLIEMTVSISSGGGLITKACFPPHVLPTVSALTNLANYIFALPLLVGYMLFEGVVPTWSFVVLPGIIALELIFLIGIGLALSALNVFFRDVQHLVGNFMTFWFFLCPIIYPADSVPDQLKFTLWLNPVALFTQVYHGIILEGLAPCWDVWVFLGAVSFASLLVGSLVFNRYREGFAELV